MFESVLGEAPRGFVSFKYAQAFFNKVADGKSIYILQVTQLKCTSPHAKLYLFILPFLVILFYFYGI